MKTKILIIMILSALLLSCNTSNNDENAQKSKISDSIQRIQEAFNLRNENTIMNYYHSNFRHNGRNFESQLSVWRERIANYTRMDFEIRDIVVDDDIATVRLVIYYYYGQNLEEIFYEPDRDGDMSYFYFDKGQWWIHGNRM